jgi:glycine cleavage system H protein
MEYPEDLKYSREHEWLRVQGEFGTIGITDFAQDQLGDVVYVDLPAVGTEVKLMEKCGEIESVKAVSDLYSPASGQVTRRNEQLIEHPELVNTSPYSDGWLIEVRLSDPTEAERLLTVEEYKELTAQAGEH